MTVPVQNPIVSYSASGATAGPFTFPFRILVPDDLEVLIGGIAADPSTYVVAGIGDDQGSVTFNSKPLQGTQVILVRQVALERDTDYQFNGDLRAVSVNADFDRLWMAMQDVAGDSSRSIHYPISESGTDGTLPGKGDRANTVVGFDVNGTQIVVPFPASIGAGDIRTDTFIDGVDYTSGTSTQLTLSRAPGTAANVEIHFDGTFQGPDQYAVVGNILTFASPIPLGVSKVYAATGTKVSLLSPSANSVGINELQWSSFLSRVVDSVAVLRTLSKIIYGRAWVTGYYGPHDGGGGAYQYDPADTTSADNGGTIIVATDGGRWKLQHMGSVCWNQFGAKNDGATDNTAALLAGLNAGIGDFYGLSGTYNVTNLNTTVSNVRFRGTEAGGTTLQSTSATGDILCVGDGTANPKSVYVSDLTFTTSVAKTSGAALRFRNGHNLCAERVVFNSYGFALNVAVQFDGGAQQFIYKMSDFEINLGAIGILAGQNGNVQDLFLNNGNVSACTTAGVYLINVSGFQFDAMDVLGCSTAFQTYPGVGQAVTFGFVSKVIADTSKNNGFNLITNGGKLSGTTFDNCWASSNGTAGAGSASNNGVYMAGNVGSLAFTNMRAINNLGAGIVLAAGSSGINIGGAQVESNSQIGVSQRSGIEIGAGVTNWSITAGKSGLGATFPVNNQQYGVLVAPGASANYQVSDNDLTGNQSGGMSDGGTGQKWVYANAGYVTSNAGAGQVAAGTTTTVINHGLSVTPLITDIHWDWTTDWWAGGATNNRGYVTATTATTFTLTTAVSSTANLFFGWSARTAGA